MDEKINKLITKRCVLYSAKNYTFLSNRQQRVAYIIIKVLFELHENEKVVCEGKTYGKRGMLTQGDLHCACAGHFKRYILEIANSYDNSAKRIRASKHKWIIVKKENVDENIYNFLGRRAITGLIFRLSPNFIKIREFGSHSNKVKSKHTFYNICLNTRGINLWNEWKDNFEGIKDDKKMEAVK